MPIYEFRSTQEGMRPIYITLTIVIIILFVGGAVIVLGQPRPAVSPPPIATSIATPVATPAAATPRPSIAVSPSPSPTSSPISQASKVLLEVPFFVQAPNAEWSNPLFQDGCEEASLLMAHHWLDGTTLSGMTALKEAILAMSSFEDEKYGPALDRSAADTAQLFRDYYSHDAVQVFYDVGAEDIKRELRAGHLVVLPMNGQALGNPNFTPPGPDRHMLVVRGFDDATQEFITNDPGTRVGAGYRYGYNQLVTAIRDYPTGNHQPMTEVKTAMVVIAKTTDANNE
ncbi:MAG: C39 family peptidase [Candidatus Andersenbacteria bacterium]